MSLFLPDDDIAVCVAYRDGESLLGIHHHAFHDRLTADGAEAGIDRAFFAHKIYFPFGTRNVLLNYSQLRIII